MRFTFLTALLTLSLLTIAGCPDNDTDTASDTTLDADNTSSFGTDSDSETSIDVVETTSGAPMGTDTDMGSSSTGATTDTTGLDTESTSDGETGSSSGTTDDIGVTTGEATSGPANESSTGEEGPTTGGELPQVCFLDTCETNDDCSDLSVCTLGAVAVFPDARTCHHKCDDDADCNSPCLGLGLPQSACLSGSCQPTSCVVAADCLSGECKPWDDLPGSPTFCF